GEPECGADRADAARGEQEAVGPRVAAEDVLGEDRHQHLVLETEPTHHAEEEKQVAEPGLRPDVAEPGPEPRGERRGGARPRGGGGGSRMRTSASSTAR